MINTVRGVSTKERKTVFVTSDEAIDQKLSDLAKYEENYDPSFLVFKEGQTATEFIIRPCSQREFRDATISVYGRPDIDEDNTVQVISIGAELLKKGLVGAKNLYETGDEHNWPAGAGHSTVLDEIPAMMQISLALAVMRISRGQSAKTELENEKK